MAQHNTVCSSQSDETCTGDYSNKQEVEQALLGTSKEQCSLQDGDTGRFCEKCNEAQHSQQCTQEAEGVRSTSDATEHGTYMETLPRRKSVTVELGAVEAFQTLASFCENNSKDDYLLMRVGSNPFKDKSRFCCL